MERPKIQWGFLQFTVVLGALVLLMPELTGARFRFLFREIFLLCAVIATSKAIQRRPQFSSALWAIWGVGAILAVAEKFPQFAAWHNEMGAVRLLLSAVIGFACAVEILRYVFEHLHGGIDSIFGSIVAYMMIVHMFAQLYGMLLFWDPTCFRFPDEMPLVERIIQGELLYFSLSTITTLGYGDIVPVTQTARGVAMIEAITGQFYMGVIVATLAGIFAENPDRLRGKGRSRHSETDSPA